jgi:hypothetical protein
LRSQIRTDAAPQHLNLVRFLYQSVQTETQQRLVALPFA